MKTILVSTDFSEVAANALEYAKGIATVTRSKILLAHVVSKDALFPIFDGTADVIYTQMVADAELQLQRMAEQLQASAAIEAEYVCSTGNLVPELNKLVADHSIDFVVMGTHGQSGLLDRLLGTNAWAYMKHAVGPTLLVPPDAQFTGIKKIAFAYDLDSEITDVLQKLFHWSAPFQAQVSIFNCLSARQLDIVPDLPLLQLITENFPVQNYCLVQRKDNDVVRGIFDFVQENQIEVLAISTHEYIFLEVLLHKSITKELLLNTKLPLLAIQETPHYPVGKHCLQELLQQEASGL